jgi:hypothetical protein
MYVTPRGCKLSFHFKVFILNHRFREQNRSKKFGYVPKRGLLRWNASSNSAAFAKKVTKRYGRPSVRLFFCCVTLCVCPACTHACLSVCRTVYFHVCDCICVCANLFCCVFIGIFLLFDRNNFTIQMSNSELPPHKRRKGVLELLIVFVVTIFSVCPKDSNIKDK